MDTQKSLKGVFGNPDFIKLWLGQILSYIGDRIIQIAFLGWLIASYGKSGSEISRVTFFSLLPSFVLGGMVGIAVDRFSRKWILVSSNVLRAVLVLVVATFFISKNPPIFLIYSILFLMGLCTAFFVPARLSILPNIVKDEDLQTANALSAAAGMIATLIGTYLAGILIQRSGYMTGFITNGILYLFAALILFSLRPSGVRTKDSAEKEASGGGMKEAVAYLASHKSARELIILSTILSFVSSFFYIALTVLAMDYYHLGTEGVGKLLSMLGIGMLIGSALAASFKKNVRPSHLIIIAFTTLFITTASAKLVNTYSLAWIWLTLIGVSNAIILVTVDTIMQKSTPDRFRGKVFGLRAMVTNGVFLVSLLGVGELLKFASPFEVFSILSLTSLLVAVFVLFIHENFAYQLFRFFIRIILKVFFSLQVEGEEFLRYKDKVILAGNHTGFLDGPLLISTFHRPVRFLVSAKVFSWPVIGFLIKKAGVIPVVEKKGVVALSHALSELQRGHAIGIFPEGKLSQDGKVGSFYRGVSKLHKDSGAPIIPFVIHGGFEAWPWNRKFPKARRVTLQFGQPIKSYAKSEQELLKELRERVQFMKEALERRDTFKNEEGAYEKSALSLMQQKSDVYGGRSALLLKEKTGWKELSYIELSRKARDLSDYLIESGFHHNDRIAILSESRPEWAIAFFASIRSGAITVPLDIKLTDAELKSILSDAKPKILFVSKEHLSSAKVLKEAISSIEKVIILEDVSEIEFPAYGALRSQNPREGIERKPDETALIIYTSGTTGNPKGVMISFSNLIFQVRSFEEIMQLSSNDMFLSILPLNHLLELTAGFMGVLHAGGRICYCQSLHPQEIARTMKEKKVTFMITVPLFLKLLKGSVEKQIKKSGEAKQKLFKAMFYLAKAIPSHSFRKILFSEIHQQFGGRLRGFLSGGAPLDLEVAQFFDTIGIPVYQGYGLSETSPVISGNTPTHNRLGSVGQPLKGVEVRIATEGPSGSEGEILTRGPHIMQGYYQREDLTKEVIDSQGWFHTGDLGKLDQEGYLHITGRIKNLIVLGGGKKIHPEEVEAVLSNTTLVKEVCVLSRTLKGGLKDGTEEVCAVVCPSDEIRKRLNHDLQAIQAEIKKEIDTLSQNLASYKRASSLLIHLEDFPKTATRKIKRPLVAEWLKGQE